MEILTKEQILELSSKIGLELIHAENRCQKTLANLIGKQANSFSDGDKTRIKKFGRKDKKFLQRTDHRHINYRDN